MRPAPPRLPVDPRGHAGSRACPTVFHGVYTGLLTEALEITAAVPSLDGAQLYATAQTSGHTTLLSLDHATGRE
jgi:hypothetical protein